MKQSSINTSAAYTSTPSRRPFRISHRRITTPSAMIRTASASARTRADLYMFDLPVKWQAEHENVSFVPVLSDSPPEENWAGRTGLVHQAVMQDFPDLSNYQIYACGVPVMVESAHRDFTTQCKLPEEEFFSDSFTPSDGAKLG